MPEEHTKESGESTSDSTQPPADTKPHGTQPQRFSTKHSIGIGILILFLGGMFFFFQQSDSATVAIVNGEHISQEEYAIQIEAVTTNASLQGLDVSDPHLQATIQEQVIENLLNTKVLLQAARDEGIVVEDEMVERAYQTFVEQLGGSEALSAHMETVNLTEENVRDDIASELMIHAYLEEHISEDSQHVTDEEVHTLYRELTEGQENVPTFEEVSAQLRTQLLTTKQYEAISSIIADLREAAEIEILTQE